MDDIYFSMCDMIPLEYFEMNEVMFSGIDSLEPSVRAICAAWTDVNGSNALNLFNSLNHRRCDTDLRYMKYCDLWNIIFSLIIIMGIPCDIDLMWMPQNLIDDMSTLI